MFSNYCSNHSDICLWKICEEVSIYLLIYLFMYLFTYLFIHVLIYLFYCKFKYGDYQCCAAQYVEMIWIKRTVIAFYIHSYSQHYNKHSDLQSLPDF
jgi:hypothetical protein